MVEFIYHIEEDYKLRSREEKEHYIRIKSSEFIKGMNDEEEIRIAIVNIKIEFAEKELREYQEKINDHEEKIKGCHLSKRQEGTIRRRITNLESNLKNLFKQRDLIFI